MDVRRQRGFIAKLRQARQTAPAAPQADADAGLPPQRMLRGLRRFGRAGIA